MKHLKRSLPFVILLIISCVGLVMFMNGCNYSFNSKTETTTVETTITETDTSETKVFETTELSETTEMAVETTITETTTATTEITTTTETTTIETTPETTTTTTTTETITTTTETILSKNVDDNIVKAVIRGDYKNGKERKILLERDGYNYSDVQKAVNDYFNLKKNNTIATESKKIMTDVKVETEPVIETTISEKENFVATEISVEEQPTYTIGDKHKASATYYSGTYYNKNNPWNIKGGSGRKLIGFNSSNKIKGSIASRTIFEKYGYNRNGSRTMVYLEFPKYSQMNGYYYLDDCCRDRNVIDIFVYYNSNCPFRQAGRVQVYWSIVD